MTKRTCLTCSNWDAKGVPRYAFNMGMAFCLVKRTQAVTLAHWRACESWAPVAQSSVDQRLAWLARVGVQVKGSSHV